MTSLPPIDFSLPQVETIYVNSKEKFDNIPSIQQDALEYLQKVKPTANVARFIFIRHGETLSNIKDLPGSPGDPLTKTGMLQAAMCGQDILKTGIAIDKVYRSPTVRTEHTNFYIQKELSIDTEAIPDESLHEINRGRYAKHEDLRGFEMEQLKREYAEVRAKDIRENTGSLKTFLDKFSYSPDPEEFESISSVYGRVSAFLNKIIANSRGHNYLVISHYVVLSTLFMQDAYRRGFDVDYRSHVVKNCAIAVIEIDKEGIHVQATKGITFIPERIK